jgi:acyl-coenzyme A synthetase/AMP-(fatty) acid ligase
MLPVADLGLLPESAAEHHGGTLLSADIPWPSAGQDPNTVGDFAAVVADYADRLWAVGVRPGQVVAVAKSPHFDIQALQCAVIRIGGLPALLSVAMEPTDLLECLEELEQPFLLTDAGGAAVLLPWQDQLGTLVARVIVLASSRDGRAAAPEATLAGAVELGEPAVHQVTRRGGTDPTLITHSSGTTGKPKLVVHTVDSLFAHAAPQISVVQAYDNSAISAKCLSFAHVRMSSGLLSALNVGVPLLGLTSPGLDAARRALLRHRPQTLEAQPNVFLRWEALARETPNPFGPVARFVSSFDAIHPRTVRTLLAASEHPDPTFIQAYGQTETGPVTILTLRRSGLREPGRPSSRDVGAPFPGMTEVRVVDDEGGVLAAGRPGHVEVRTPGRAESVVGRAPLPGRDHWWPMGDIGVLRADGHLEVLDRDVDQVPSVPSTLQAEDVLLDELPELAEVVIVAVGGTVTAVVSTVDGTPVAEDRWRHARRAAGLPETVKVDHWAADELPVTGTVKVRRHRLAGAMLAEQEGRRG